MDYSLIIVLITISILVFIVCREFVCWYFKINERVELLKSIEYNTRKEVKASKDVSSLEV